MERRIMMKPSEELRELMYQIYFLNKHYGEELVKETFKEALVYYEKKAINEQLKQELRQQLKNAFLIYVIELLEYINEMAHKEEMIGWLRGYVNKQ
jgi:hypothetical protein